MARRRALRVVVLLLPTMTAFAWAAACDPPLRSEPKSKDGGHTIDGDPPVADDSGYFDDLRTLDGPIHPDASCLVTIFDPKLQPLYHIPIGTTYPWDSNPPSSGAHYPIWAAYMTYTTPVPPGYFLHNLEHGAVVFFYNCSDPSGCPDLVSGLQMAEDALPDDPLCDKEAGLRVRALITPDPTLPTPVAAATWGWIYTAACIDLPTLIDFATLHYGRGPQTNCDDGQSTF